MYYAVFGRIYDEIITSFEEIRDLIVLCYDQGIINDAEFLILYDSYESPNLPNLPYTSYPLFDLDEMEDDECPADFRVKE